MEIAVIGTGYVGLVVGTCLADTGNHVISVDKDNEKIRMLKDGIIPIYEPGLEEIVERNMKEGRLKFTEDLQMAVEKSKIVFLAVGTPPNNDGSVDLSAVYEVAKDVGNAIKNGYKIIINKSTVPVGTSKKVREIISERTDASFDVVSNPEFLKEGNAVEDFMKPDRIVIGTDNSEVAEILRDLYSPFVRTGNPILIMGIESAEMTKYASNALLATKISFMNEIANLCEKVYADIEEVRKGVGSDPRIGPKFIFPGVGYGGSCFPKDVKAIYHTGKENGLDMRICRAVDMVNEEQKVSIFRKLKSHFDSLDGVRVAIWGLSFKPRTDDIREAPSIVTINHLLDAGANIVAYDPEANARAEELFGDKIEFASNPMECLEGADALALLTEWNEFRHPDFEEVSKLMKQKVIFDGRNIYNMKKLRELGFTYYGIGRT